MTEKKRSIRGIYKEYGLRYDVREARKLLNLPKNTPKKLVNRYLRDDYNDIWREFVKEKDFVYQYTLSGQSREIIEEKDKKPKLSPPITIELTFVSKTKYNIKKGHFYYNLNLDIDLKLQLKRLYNLPIVNLKVLGNDDEAFYDEISDIPNAEWNYYFDNNYNIAMEWMKLNPNRYMNYVVNTLLSVSRRKVIKNNNKIKDVPMYNPSINLPYPEFNGFKDSGKMMCVPETVYHHLTLNDRNKKLTLEKIIDEFDSLYCDDEFEEGEITYFTYDETECGELECPDEVKGTMGYTAEDVIQILEKYKVKGRLLDINLKQFLTTKDDLKVDKHLPVFVGIVYDNHLYYCDDAKFVKSLAEKQKENSTGFSDLFLKTQENSKLGSLYLLVGRT